MTGLANKFFQESSIPLNDDTTSVMNFLTKPESVNRMIVMSEVGLPALAGVVGDLERDYKDNPGFPLHHNALNANAPNRRNVGWMIRFVMKQYGWTPIAVESANERTRMGRFSSLFGTAAIYEKSNMNPDNYISVVNNTKLSQICHH